jgi:Ser/Thr protein kinase RdoA (MazF antagonist)
MTPEPAAPMTAYGAVRLAAQFGIDGIEASELGGGWVNVNWLVTSRDGSRFVVRRYEGLNVTQRGIAFEHATMRYAGQRVPEVHPPLVDREGWTFIMDDDDWYVAAFPYVEGRTGDRDAAAGAAGVLARFHLALTDFHAERPRVARSVGILGWLRQRFLHFAAQPQLARSLDWDALMLPVSRASVHTLAKSSRLPLTTVHGDPHPDNFVSDAGSVAGFLDFDFAHEGERLYDVASAADTFGRSDEDAPLDLVAARAFVEAYHSHAPLTTEEWELVPDLMIRRNAFLVWYVVSRHGERAAGDIGNAERYARRVTEIYRLRHEWKKMAS